MDLMQIATKMMADKLGPTLGNIDPETLQGALGSLLGGSDGQLDIGGLVEKFSGGDLGGLLQSWLGDGDNDAISADQIMSALGDSNINDFASKLGIDAQTAADGLANSVPGVIDQASSGGSLLDSLGGAAGLMDAAKKLF